MWNSGLLSIGLMSGTSMDGIDAALIETDGKVQIKELETVSLEYDPDFKILLKATEYVVRHQDGNLLKAKEYFYPKGIKNYLINELKLKEDLAEEKLKNLILYLKGDRNHEIAFDEIIDHSTRLHAKVINTLLANTQYKSEDIDVIGYHGQTLYHRPAEKMTIQIGNGKLLADLTGITVVNDFRTQDVAAGGQGAPLAPLYHQALALRDKKYPMAVINCGGIANVTVITGSDYHELIGFDTGPGNGLLDRLIKQRTASRESMDKDGKYGTQGKVDNKILKLLYEKAVIVQNEKNYFTIDPPKSLDIGDLTLIPELDALSLPDAAATLAAFTADTIVNSIDYFKNRAPQYWVLAGGGWNNPVIKQELEKRLKDKLGKNIKVMTADEMGWNSKAMEAQVFAYLAVRSLQDLPISLPSTTRVPKPLSGGHVYKSKIGLNTKIQKLLATNTNLLIN